MVVDAPLCQLHCVQLAALLHASVCMLCTAVIAFILLVPSRMAAHTLVFNTLAPTMSVPCTHAALCMCVALPHLQLPCKHWEPPAQLHSQATRHWAGSMHPRHPRSCSTQALLL